MTTKLELITGKPGCGKSFMLKQKPKTLLTSTTGITALNLSNSSRTINSTLGYFNRQDLIKNIQQGNILQKLLKISSVYETIGLDEASMTIGEVIDLIVPEVAKHNKLIEESRKLKKKHNFLGFCVAGDVGQLPFVEDKQDKEKNLTSSPFFMAKSMKFFNKINLTEIKRQNDREFVEVLNYVRFGKVKDVIDWFVDNVEFSDTIEDNWEGSTFFALNKEVNQYNHKILEKLNTPEKFYHAEFSGIPNPDWITRGRKAGAIPEYVIVKPGMKVMILANNFEEMYANGDLGIVVDCFPNGVLVELFRNKRQVLVNYRTVYNTTIATNKKTGEPYEKRIGSCNYLPVRQGDSSSYHKCLDGETLISTTKGLIPLKSIKEGDYALTSDGSYQKVLAHVYSGKKQNVKIITQEGITLNSSITHPFLVRNNEGVEEFKQVLDIKEGDFLCVTRPKASANNINDLSWLLGALVGDGYYNDKVDYRVEFSKNSNIYERFVNILKSFNLKVSERIRKENTRKTDIKGCYVHSINFRVKLLELGLDYVKAVNKSVPKFILENEDLNCVAGFLQGIFDTDGCVRTNTKSIVLTSCSKILITQTQQLLLRFGIVSNVYLLREATEKWNPHFQLIISGDKNIRLFRNNISLTEESKLKKLLTLANKVNGKTNTDHIPISKEEIAKIQKNLRGIPKSGKLRAFLNQEIYNLSYVHLKEIIDLYKSKAPQHLVNILENHYFYSKIKSINTTKEYIDMYDIEVENNPTFVANSVVVHNCQGLTLDKVQLSVTGDGGRFLSNLSGGLYTGITRVTDYKGLRIVGTKDDFIKACYINPLYLNYLIKLDSLSQPQLMAA